MSQEQALSKDTLVIYHGNCADGFTAAWAAWKILDDTADYYPGFYGKEPPDVTGKYVVLLDFSYKRDVLKEMAKKAFSIVILDHHKSAEADLKDLQKECPNVYPIFDMNKSGAVLAWEYFHQGQPIPEMVLHVQDRDLWRFKMDRTKEFQACMFSYEYTFENWEKLAATPVESLKTEGTGILRKHMKDIRELMDSCTMWVHIRGHKVPCLNVPYMHGSDSASELLEVHQDAPFAAYYYDKEGQRAFGLRSKDDRMDVSEIAASFGGGGHRNASGFIVKAGTDVSN